VKTTEAIAIARRVKSQLKPNDTAERRALVALLDHGDSVLIPDFEVSVRMVGANLDALGKSIVLIAVDPKTKVIGWTFTPPEHDAAQPN
jgi:hypothetical protein